MKKHRIARILALLVTAYAAVVMCGWVFGISQLTQVGASPGMKFMTSLLFFFGGIGLFLISKSVNEENEVALTVLPGVSLVIFLITTTLLISRILGTSTGLEELFVSTPGPVNTNTLAMSGWPSIATLADFVLFGLVGIAALFRGQLREKVIPFAGYTLALSGAVALLGHIFGTPVLFYQLSSLSMPMALNTALAFVLLGAGLTLVGRPELER